MRRRAASYDIAQTDAWTKSLRSGYVPKQKQKLAVRFLEKKKAIKSKAQPITTSTSQPPRNGTSGIMGFHMLLAREVCRVDGKKPGASAWKAMLNCAPPGLKPLDDL
ncbi:unnamed protein product [Heligmosomoides polygyrus]|uniref:Transposase n=1 Tax=Heligmosomoides polygyrus TaxID=6339 RepID=A0A3P7YUV4_HELPZ|nr:unnamed protein product [Heligmosomoides polygyrus]